MRRPNVQSWTRPAPMVRTDVKVDLTADPNGPALLLHPDHVQWFTDRLKQLDGGRPR